MAEMSRALILMYHQVDTPQSAQEHRFCTPPDEFARQMDRLAAAFVPVSLDALLGGIRGEQPLPERAVHVTFDDGFAGVLEHAAPVLAARKIPATMFAVSGRLGQSNDWMARRGFPERPLLTAAGLRELEAMGFVIGSHTCSHARLTELGPDQVAEEVTASKHALEDALGKEVRHFAYPYGLQNDAVRDAVVSAGYAAACATVSGFNRRGEDVFRMRRIDVFGTDRLWQFQQKLRFGRNESNRFYAVQYYAGRVKARLGLQ
jgi:peptidoglycan/xylan/chitin deacetylase (PgdA/CDA1 family)